jgi:hypothetical protein
MKLRQGQLWDLGGQYVRIVVLERLSVEYKAMKDLLGDEGTRHRVTKKEFCTLIKHATLVPPISVRPHSAQT